MGNDHCRAWSSSQGDENVEELLIGSDDGSTML